MGNSLFRWQYFQLSHAPCTIWNILIIINDLCTIFLQRKRPKNICQVTTFHQVLHLNRSGIVRRQLMQCSAWKAVLGVHIEGTQNPRSHRYFIDRLFFSTLRPTQICTDKMTNFADRNTQTAALAKLQKVFAVPAQGCSYCKHKWW